MSQGSQKLLYRSMCKSGSGLKSVTKIMLMNLTVLVLKSLTASVTKVLTASVTNPADIHNSDHLNGDDGANMA